MLSKSGKLAAPLGLALILTVAACASAPYTGRNQVLLVSEGSEISLGLQTFENIKRQRRPSPDPGLQELVNRVGRRIAAAVNRPDFRWEFVVFEDDRQANAFCLPGGKVGVFTGLLRYTQDEIGLATLSSREAAHVLARHAGERLSQSMLAQVGGMGLGLGMGMAGGNPYASQAIMQAYGLGTQVGVLMPYGRTQEYEADQIGLILMARAGYDPRAALDFWQRMMARQNQQFRPPEFLSTHPSDANRIEVMRQFLPQAMNYYLAPPEPYPDPAPQTQLRP